MLEHSVEISEKEREKILDSTFESLEPLVLSVYSTKFKKKLVILDKIFELFDSDRKYTESEVNGIIRPVFDDFVTIRRDLIEMGYLDRSRNGSEYWVSQEIQ